MTANVTITTAEAKGVVWAPSRSIKTSNGSTRQVRILVEGEPQERIVETGLRGDEGRIEIKSGLKEGDIVVLGEKK
jgi:multidrug efflux pump subunit AcrA (membrane-fusion protein)